MGLTEVKDAFFVFLKMSAKTLHSYSYHLDGKKVGITEFQHHVVWEIKNDTFWLIFLILFESRL
jgi:hypothetical protein